VKSSGGQSVGDDVELDHSHPSIKRDLRCELADGGKDALVNVSNVF
jgi:hypothetical protein